MTPVELITAVISELAVLPCASVSVVLRAKQAEMAHKADNNDIDKKSIDLIRNIYFYCIFWAYAYLLLLMV